MDLVSSFLSQKNIDSEITFEKYIMLNTKLNNEKQYSVKDACYFNANNDNFKQYYDENKILEIHLNNMLFEQYLSFDNVKKLSLIINDNVKFDKLFINNCNELYLKFNGRVEVIDKISINNCKFKQISINNHIDGNIEFQKCEFNDFNLYGFCDIVIKGDFKFNFCEVKEIANFMNFKFKNKAYFKMSKFKDNVYFNNSHFYDYANFHECEFEKTACFYGVKFEKVPNFSACYFKEQKAVNLINIDIDKLNFKSVENYIKDNYKDKNYKDEINEAQDEKSISKIENKYKLKCAKDCKDSFRVIKDVLTNQNNTLEAQEWHKLELYAKEKELEIKLGEDEKSKSKRKIKKISFRKNIIEDILVDAGHFVIYFSIFINELIFNFFLTLFKTICKIIYKIVKFVLSCIFKCFLTLFKIICYILFCIFHITSIDRIIKLTFLKYNRKISRFGKRMTDFTLWFDCVLLHIYRNTSDHHTNFLKILNFTILMISLYAIVNYFSVKTVSCFLSPESRIIIFISYVIFIILTMPLMNLKKQFILSFFVLVFITCGICIVTFWTFLASAYASSFYFIIYFLSIFIFYILFTCKIKLFVFILRLLAYVVLVIVLFEKPQLINPFIGVFSSDKIYESQLEKKLNDFNTSVILNLAKISQKDFNLSMDYKDISFTELNSAQKIIIDNKENLKEILSSIYNKEHKEDYKRVLQELENNASNLKNIIQQIDKKNNNSFISARLYEFLKLNFGKFNDLLYLIKSNFSFIAKKLKPQELATFDKKDNQEKLKNILSLLKFEQKFEEVIQTINQDKIMQGALKSTSILYSIILLLCVFSLQKTARKNSIVPS
ncbi:pentapeptide repeat-containing protein [Campylobacter taeniopygiae]|uniref:pentapeptide repeat-containing protein n=1 Tax=Campylobacter taeniopygiae TaxID=2510188 RepID=UPI003D6BFE10